MKMTSFYRTIFFICLFLLSLDSFATVLTISGKVFHDRNKNSTLDASETGISRTYIRLFYKPNSSRWETTLVQTDSNGEYLFSVNLAILSGFKYTVLELGPNPGPAVGSGIDPKDFNHNDIAIPGGFNGTTTLRRISGPDLDLSRLPTIHNFGHANFATFSPTLPNALVIGQGDGIFGSASNIYHIDLSTGNSTILLDSNATSLPEVIAGLGYHRKTNTYMGCAIDFPYKGAFIIIENTSPLKITKLPLGENVWFYAAANHGVDISPDGFMVDFAAGTGYSRSIFDVRPSSVNFLQRVDLITKKFNPETPNIQDVANFAELSDLAFNPVNGLMYSIDPSNGGSLKRRGSIYESPVSLGPIIFETGLPIPPFSYLLTFFDNNNHLFVISNQNRLLYKIDVNTRVANVISSFPLQLNEYTMEGASNPNVTIPTQGQALRLGLWEQQSEALVESVIIRPNPAVDKRISISHETGIDAVEMFNSSGQSLLQQKAFGKKSIDISLPSNTATGNYLIRIVGSDGKIVTKNIVVE